MKGFKMRNICCAVFLCVVFSTISFSQEMREWTDTKGKTIKAELVSVGKDSVKLRNEDGKEATIKIVAFSDNDQEYIKNLAPYTGMLFLHLNDPTLKDKLDLKSLKNSLTKSSNGKIKFENAFIVFSVEPDTPAFFAGIRSSDVITLINGKVFKDAKSFSEWRDTEMPEKLDFSIWSNSSKHSKFSRISVTPVYLNKDEVAKRKVEEQEKKVTELQRKNVFYENVVGLNEAHDRMLKLVKGAGFYDTDLFSGEIVPNKKQDINGIDFLKNPQGLYGVVIRYKTTKYDDYKCYMLLYVKNTSDKAIKSVILKTSFVDPNRSVPYGETILGAKPPGGIEPQESRAVEFLTVDGKYFQYPPPELQESMECQIQILGYTFYDDEEVGEDILHPSRQERK